MTQVEKAKKALAKTQTMDIATLIQRSAAELGKALPAHMRPERIVRIALTTLRMNPNLYKCNPQSFLAALFQSAQLGLEPNVEGQAYIIPYGENAQFQIGYKGYVELFFRHQSALSLDMQEVRENDDFDYQYGTESFIKHRPALKDRGEVIAYYAVAKLKDGASLFKVMSKDDCLDHGKKHSKNFSSPSSTWKKDQDAMCKKTVLIQLMKLLPKSIEIQKALAMDETVKTKVAADMFEVKDEVDYAADPHSIDKEKAGDTKDADIPESKDVIIMITEEQHKKIEAMIAEAIKKGADKDLRTKAHKWMDVDSFKDLTKDQASKLIEQIQITLNEVNEGGKN